VNGRKKRTSKGTLLPADFVLSDEGIEYALSKGLDTDRAHHEFEKFCSFHQAKGNTYVDWGKAWQNWILRTRPEQRANGRRSRDEDLANVFQGFVDDGK
jgi:hypothetical protein